MTNENPAYGLMETDEEFMVPLNYQMYAMNVTAANENNKADWNLTVDYVKDYDLADYVSPNEMHALAERIQSNTTLAQLYKWDESRKMGLLANVTT